MAGLVALFLDRSFRLLSFRLCISCVRIVMPESNVARVVDAIGLFVDSDSPPPLHWRRVRGCGSVPPVAEGLASLQGVRKEGVEGETHVERIPQAVFG